MYLELPDVITIQAFGQQWRECEIGLYQASPASAEA